MSDSAVSRDGCLRRVLLADDHPSVLEQMRDLLLPEFEIVGTAMSGSAMIAAALQWRPEVIVADVDMPVMDGIEAARQLKRLAYRGAFVFVSMSNDVEIMEAAFSAGADAYILKIKAGTELIPAIRAVLQGRKFIPPGAEPGA